MEKCPVKLLGFLNCSNMRGRRCLIAQNAGVEDGNLDELKGTFGNFRTEALLDLLEAHSPRSKDKLARSCAASPTIVRTIREILKERGLQSR